MCLEVHVSVRRIWLGCPATLRVFGFRVWGCRVSLLAYYSDSLQSVVDLLKLAV